MAGLIVKCGPTEFDHVALATRDTEEGVAWLAERTGASPFITEPEPGEWYWSGALPLANGASIEIIGPNPAYQGFHPFKELFKRYNTPAVLFWHLGTSDFDRLAVIAKAAGAPMERIEHLDSDTPFGRRLYSRAILGPGFMSARPCVIQWKERPQRPGMDAPVCAATRFAVQCSDPEPLNRVFDALGLDLRVTRGPHRVEVDLDTPNGLVTLSGEGLTFAGAGGFLKLIGLRLTYQFGL